MILLTNSYVITLIFARYNLDAAEIFQQIFMGLCKGENDDIITLSMFAHMQSQGKYSLSGWIVAVCYRVDPSQQWTSLTNDYLSDKAKKSINLNQVLTLAAKRETSNVYAGIKMNNKTNHVKEVWKMLNDIF